MDKEAETKWNFSLKDSISRATQRKLLGDYIFHVMATSGTDVLKGNLFKHTLNFCYMTYNLISGSSDGVRIYTKGISKVKGVFKIKFGYVIQV